MDTYDETLLEVAKNVFEEEILEGTEMPLSGVASYERDIIIGQMAHLAMASMRRWAKESKEAFDGYLGERPKADRSIWVCQLPEKSRVEVKRRLVAAGVSGDDLERGMRSKIADLEDTISLEGILEPA